MPSWMSLGFQDFSSFPMLELTSFHDYVMVIMLMVVVVISYVLVFLLLSKYTYKYLVEGGMIETIWSIIPAFLLLVLVVPSMSVLYLMENIISPSMSVKVVGHQWYWTYVVPFFNNLFYKMGDEDLSYYEFDSMLEDYSFSFEFPRLLGCSDYLHIPVGVGTRFLITSTDVIHAFSVPSLGLKVDALPGRINQLISTPSRVGLFFGQCSEICGSNHSFMPIGVKILHSEEFKDACYSYLFAQLLDSDFKVDKLVI